MTMTDVFTDQKHRELRDYYAIRDELEAEAKQLGVIPCNCCLCTAVKEQIAALEAALREVPANG